ncbi:high affinity cAMP-specific and IBMX-insensitive 3',5'-cyclic phosphodiesterase 8A-like [Eubalaena glacialis]|uniref:high affinity cAMP-specific and IBMX-insensitive 3',5'-cyclic phosphodiesterase 8A-like n=1 Tax=Eubalaena glacialis TaxID=27606 RepID=UPI002A5A176E|nr:high affinity cAMP-specific and IBMX-insensitive 3',5'-cyclic phosphodiesterase 8A-like [Eubalaena glacialis]
MGCAPSIHASESRAVYHGGNEAEDAPGPTATPLLPGGPRLPPGQTTAASARSCGSSLVESEPSGGSGSGNGNTKSSVKGERFI